MGLLFGLFYCRGVFLFALLFLHSHRLLVWILFLFLLNLLFARRFFFLFAIVHHFFRV